MASIDLSPQQVVVRLSNIDSMLALRTSLTIPLEHIDNVRALPAEADFDMAVRDPSVGTGLFIVGQLAVGSVELPDGRAFFDVRNKQRTLALDLHHEDYRHVVIELDDESPEDARRRIADAVNRARALRARKDGRSADYLPI